MDFFRSQDIARRNTVRLVLLFLLSLVCLIAITNVMVFFALGFASADAETSLQTQVDWRLFVWISLGVLAVVGFGSLYKIFSLSGGGARVAEMMQGRLLQPGSGNLAEQRLLNVVEEMAIASGTPVPPVYVMEEAAINAFAAGFAPGDAVIGVTRGTIENLSRAELQGVIAHEFSHILHGDMRLNIRLIGVLHGIMVLGIMGYYLMRTTGLSSRRNNNSGNLVFVGIGLIVIGYAGTFFGNLIKAAVSRQREFLADASAVQYTRNPAGIADALKRIGGGPGSVMENPRTAEISHALFSNGMTFSLNSMFATHPPLEERIRRIQPDWDGSYELPPPTEQSPYATTDSQPSADSRHDLRSGGAAGAITTLAMMDALLARAGELQEIDLQQARTVLASVPTLLREAAHDPFGARAVIYLLLLDGEEEVAEAQLSHLRPVADVAVLSSVDGLRALCAGLAMELRLPLATLCLPALRQLSAEQYTGFRDNVLVMMKADGRISLWEWVLQRVVIHSLDAVFMPRSDLHNVRHRSLKELASEVANTLALMVRVGRLDREQEETTFRRAMTLLELQDVAMPGANELSIDNINVALDALVALKAQHKQALLKACVHCIVADGVATAQELEIVRAIAVTLDCPLPPIPSSFDPVALSDQGSAG